MRIRGVDLINYIIYKGLISCWGPKPLASEVMSSSPSMLSIVVGFCSSAMVGNIWYLFHWRWLPNFTRSLRSSLAMLSSSLVEIGPVGDDLFKSRRRIGAPWPSWCGCIVCAMSDEQQCAMCLSDYDLFRIKISWRSLLEFLRGFVCLDEAPYTARWPWHRIPYHSEWWINKNTKAAGRIQSQRSKVKAATITTTIYHHTKVQQASTTRGSTTTILNHMHQDITKSRFTF